MLFIHLSDGICPLGCVRLIPLLDRLIQLFLYPSGSRLLVTEATRNLRLEFPPRSVDPLIPLIEELGGSSLVLLFHVLQSRFQMLSLLRLQLLDLVIQSTLDRTSFLVPLPHSAQHSILPRRNPKEVDLPLLARHDVTHPFI
jgi:hypothetical protein